MKGFANYGGRAALISDIGVIDLHQASDGSLPADPMDALRALAAGARLPESERAYGSVDASRLGPPVPRPSKILAAGMNYRSHIDEEEASVPDEPVVFARLPSALAGPRDDVVLPDGDIDWEAEVVVVIGRRARYVSRAEAWSHVFGLAAGQDITDRVAQNRGLKQYTLAKSHDTFAPLGPCVVPLDELPDPEDLAICCRLNGEIMQEGRSSQLVFDIPTLVSWISAVCTLEVGDLIFTGTPGGVGADRKPPRYLQSGDVLETEVEGLGTLVNRCVTVTPGS